MKIELATQYQIAGYTADFRYVAHFSWSDADPAALRVTFAEPSGSEPVEWVFGRELCFDGITSTERVGLGDVQIQSFDHSRFKIFLSSPEGDAEIVLATDPMLEFLQRTERVVPTAVFEDSTEEKRIFHELDYAIEAILAERGQA